MAGKAARFQGGPAMADPFLTWLDSAESFEDLRPCARLVIRRAEKLGVVLDDSYLQDGDFNIYLDAVASGLWAFLKEEAENISRQATTFLTAGDKIGLGRLISNEYIDSCLNKRRNDSPFHAYYRHMVAVLREAEGVNFCAIPRKCSYYAWSQVENLPIEPDDHDFHSSYMDYESWPACSIPFSDINKKDQMIALSRHYWVEALRMILAEYLFSIRGLVAFAASKYPLIPEIEYEPGVEDENEGEQKHRVFGETLVNPERQLPFVPPAIVEVDLDQIARDCAAKLTKEEKIVVAMLDSSTGMELAMALGKKGPSNVDYYKRPALRKVGEAWSLWGQPDSEFYAVEVEECRIFIKKLVGFCKEALACRDSGKEGRP